MPGTVQEEVKVAEPKPENIAHPDVDPLPQPADKEDAELTPTPEQKDDEDAEAKPAEQKNLEGAEHEEDAERKPGEHVAELMQPVEEKTSGFLELPPGLLELPKPEPQDEEDAELGSGVLSTTMPQLHLQTNPQHLMSLALTGQDDTRQTSLAPPAPP